MTQDTPPATGETSTPPVPSVVEVMLAHQFTVNDNAVGGLAATVEDLNAFALAPVYATCTCGRWERECGTIKGAETKRGEHAEHVTDELRALGLLARDTDPVEACNMVHQEPYDFAECRTHDTTFRLGDACKFNNRVMWEAYQDEADEQRGLKVRAEMEAEQAALELDSLKGAIQRVLDDHPVSTAAIAEKIKPLLATDADPLREAQQAAWKFGHSAGTRGLGEDTNPFTPR